MRTGLDNKRSVAVLIGLGVVLAGALWYFVSSVVLGGGPPPAAPAAATNAAPQESNERATGGAQTVAMAPGGHTARKVASLEHLDPTLHPELMAGAESLEYSGSGRNIFSMASAPPNIEKPIAPPRPVATLPPAPVGPPPPPPIDLKFFGYEANGGAKKAFLLHGDDVFIASEGDVVDHHYKIVKINPFSIQVTDLLYNNTQTLPLTQS